MRDSGRLEAQNSSYSHSHSAYIRRVSRASSEGPRSRRRGPFKSTSIRVGQSEKNGRWTSVSRCQNQPGCTQLYVCSLQCAAPGCEGVAAALVNSQRLFLRNLRVGVDLSITVLLVRASIRDLGALTYLWSRWSKRVHIILLPPSCFLFSSRSAFDNAWRPVGRRQRLVNVHQALLAPPPRSAELRRGLLSPGPQSRLRRFNQSAWRVQPAPVPCAARRLAARSAAINPAAVVKAAWWPVR